MNPYQHLVAEYARFAREGQKFSRRAISTPAPRPRPQETTASKVLIFSPHPDDECIIGGLALRLLREARMNVINNGGYTRRPEGAAGGALSRIGAGLSLSRLRVAAHRAERAGKSDFENPRRRPGWMGEIGRGRRRDIGQWRRRGAIFVPHERDWHSTHIGTHFLVLDALRKAWPAGFECCVVETEFWGAMDTPNPMTVESGVPDVVDLVTATSFHVGEVRRNPYHLRLPAWMQDNVRRGGELVGGAGAGSASRISSSPPSIVCVVGAKAVW